MSRLLKRDYMWAEYGDTWHVMPIRWVAGQAYFKRGGWHKLTLDIEWYALTPKLKLWREVQEDKARIEAQERAKRWEKSQPSGQGVSRPTRAPSPPRQLDLFASYGGLQGNRTQP